MSTEITKDNNNYKIKYEILKDSGCTPTSSLKIRLESIKTLSKYYKIKIICEVLNVNRSTYYKYLKSDLGKRKLENKKYAQIIKEILRKYKYGIGPKKIAEIMKKEEINISPNRVKRIMVNEGMYKNINYNPASTHMDPMPENLVYSKNKIKELFTEYNVFSQELVFCIDITNIKMKTRMAYLCAIIDLYNKKIVGWNVGYHENDNLIIPSIKMCIMNKNPENKTIFHSDRGPEFMSIKIQQLLKKNHFIRSHSEKSTPSENAVIESFFKHLKDKIKTKALTINNISKLKDEIKLFLKYYENIPHEGLGFMSSNDLSITD